jgi:hypothetical protein
MRKYQIKFMNKETAHVAADGFDTHDKLIKFFVHNKEANLNDFVAFAPLENVMFIDDIEYDAAAYEKQYNDMLAGLG